MCRDLVYNVKFTNSFSIIFSSPMVNILMWSNLDAIKLLERKCFIVTTYATYYIHLNV